MIIKIFSKHEIEIYEPYKDFKYLVFSFYTLQQPDLNENFKKRIIRFFHLNVHDASYEVGDYNYFLNKHAREILYLVDIWKNDIDCIICQCDMGISRSSALAYSISKYLNLDTDWIKNNFRYCPNERIVDIMERIIKYGG